MEPEQDATVEQKRQSRLLSMLFDNQIPIWKYVLRAGLISLVPSLAIVMILGLTGVMTEESGPEFEGTAIGLFIGIVIISPPLETLLMGVLFRILSFITKQPVRLAIISACVWAGVHSLIAWAWGLGVIWPFFVFSCSYLGWRRRSWRHAILVTSCVHAFQNTLPTVILIASL